jgi:hypothetical protein
MKSTTIVDKLFKESLLAEEPSSKPFARSAFTVSPSINQQFQALVVNPLEERPGFIEMPRYIATVSNGALQIREIPAADYAPYNLGV